MIVAFLPRSLLHRLLSDQATAWHANVVLSHTALLAAISLSAILPLAGCWPHVCLVRHWTGLACPGCGIITSVDRLSHGNLVGSLGANPAGVVLVVGLVLHLVLHALAVGRRQHRPLCNRLSHGIGVSFWTVLSIVWLCRLFSHHL